MSSHERVHQYGPRELSHQHILWSLADWSRSTVKKKIEIKKDWFYFITSFSMIIIARYSYVHDLFINVLLFA